MQNAESRQVPTQHVEADNLIPKHPAILLPAVERPVNRQRPRFAAMHNGLRLTWHKLLSQNSDLGNILSAAVNAPRCNLKLVTPGDYLPAGGRGLGLGGGPAGWAACGCTMVPGSSSTSCGCSTGVGCCCGFCRDETEFGPSVDGATGVKAACPLRPLNVISPSLVEMMSPGRKVGSVFTSKVASPNGSLPLQLQLATRCLR